MPPVQYIDSDRDFADLITSLHQTEQIAIDTESNSMYAYYGQVCLIQLSTRQQDYIIDPFALDDLQALGAILYDDKIEKIFHAADYDLICLKRDFGFEVRNLFDTMFAARLIGAQVFGLADLLMAHFQVKVDKSHQRDNWGQRPLPAESLIYAQMDTHYLHRLRDNLHHELQVRGLLPEVEEIFQDVLRIEVKERAFDPDGYWKIGRPTSLNRRQMAILRELYILREDIAQTLDKPPFKVITNKTLVHIARQRPQRFKDLAHMKGLSAKILRSYGDQIIQAVDRGRTSKVPKPPKRETPDPLLIERYSALHAWRKQRAIKRGLDSSLIVSKQTLWELAHKLPQTIDELSQIDGIGAWRLQHYSDDLLAITRQFNT